MTAQTTGARCACGCGEGARKHFKAGHDARYIGRLKRVADGRLKPGDLPKVMRDAVKLKKSGDGWIATVHYDGQPMGRRRYWTAAGGHKATGRKEVR